MIFRLIYCWRLVQNALLEDWLLWRPHSLIQHESVKYVQNAPPRWSLGLNSSKGSRDIEQPSFWIIINAGWPPNLYSMSKMLPIGDILVQIGQPRAEILSSLPFVLSSSFCPYLRGQLSFWGYFFAREATPSSGQVCIFIRLLLLKFWLQYSASTIDIFESLGVSQKSVGQQDEILENTSHPWEFITAACLG